MFDVFNKKQMYNSVITWKQNASKDCNCIISMFLMSFNIHFVFGYACFMCIYVLRLPSGYFGDNVKGLAFFGEDRLANLV